MFTRQFKKLSILTQDKLGDYENVVAFIRGEWQIRHSDYPLGVASHYVEQELDLSGISSETFTRIEDVTDEQIEKWASKNITNEAIELSYKHALPVIQQSHKINSLTVYYDANEGTDV